MTRNYTLIAFRPEGRDDGKGHSSSSWIEISTHPDPNPLIARAAAILFHNELEERTNYSIKRPRFTVLIDGLDRDALCAARHWDDAEAIDELEERIPHQAALLRQARHRHEAEEAERARSEHAAEAERLREEAETGEIDLLHSLIARHGIPQWNGE